MAHIDIIGVRCIGKMSLTLSWIACSACKPDVSLLFSGFNMLGENISLPKWRTPRYLRHQGGCNASSTSFSTVSKPHLRFRVLLVTKSSYNSFHKTLMLSNAVYILWSSVLICALQLTDDGTFCSNCLIWWEHMYRALVFFKLCATPWEKEVSIYLESNALVLT